MSERGERDQHERRMARRIAQQIHEQNGGANGQHNYGRLRKRTDPNGVGEDALEDLYFYDCPFGTITALQSVTYTLNIQADTKFEWMDSGAWGVLATEAEPWQTTDKLPMNIFMVDSSDGTQLMSNPMPVDIITTPISDRALPVSRIFAPKATLSITLTSLSAATYNNVHFTFIGRKITGPDAHRAAIGGGL